MPPARRRKINNTTNNEAEPVKKLSRVIFNLPVPEIPKRKGNLFVCGQGDTGQLGLGEDLSECKRPSIVKGLSNIVEIDAGGMHSLCLTQAGEIFSFGCNDEGALGRDTSEEGSDFVPKKIDLPGKSVKISAGDSHSASLLEDGRVFAWGSFRNSHGSMGLTLEGNKRIPVEILPNVKACDISSGADHLVVLACNGNVYTVGCGEQGQLGRISLRDAGGESRRGKTQLLRPDLIQVKFKKQFSAIWTTVYCTFVQEATTGAIYAFGLNNYSQLSLKKTDLPVSLPLKTKLENVLTIAGGQHHTLVLTKSKQCTAIGRKDYGRLGLGELTEDVTTLTSIETFNKIDLADISCGDAQSFAITTDGKLYGWGMGSNHSLGTGEENDEILPVLINSKQTQGKKFFKVASGGQHSLFLVENGK